MADNVNLKIRTIAANIRKIRIYKNYTQDYLAAKLKISQNAYSKLELGYTKITLERLFHVAGILEVDIVDLIKSDSSQLIQMTADAVS